MTLVWIYISWLVVLVGAETARCLAIFSQDYKQPDITARQLLGFFFMDRKKGVSIEQAAAWGYLGKHKLRRILARLQQSGLVQVLGDGRYGLTDKAVAMSVVELSSELTEQLKLI